MTNFSSQQIRNLPGVDKVLQYASIKPLIKKYSKNLVTAVIREVISNYRRQILAGEESLNMDNIGEECVSRIQKIAERSLKPILNGSGIIIHTNLGRAPYGEELLEEVFDVLKGYNNLEFNLAKGSRGQRNDHASEILKYLTGAEDIVIVNNNAAAVMLILRAFGRGKEAIVSRGELIEIGGSFRIPEIMAASDCGMVEVGATNKTKVADYEKAINENTALLFKTHTSNYVIKGFTQELSLEELSGLGKKYDIPTVYDIGSGLLRKVDEKALMNEPDVKQALASGVDMICFSGDKLLGGPQAGIIAGKKEFIQKLKKEPMMRALRVGKTTLAILEKACSYYLNDQDLFKHNVLFRTLNTPKLERKESSEYLQSLLAKKSISSSIEPSKGQYGGGTLPDLVLDSYSVKLNLGKGKSTGKQFYHELLNQKPALLTNLKSGSIYVDLLCLQEKDLDDVAELIKKAYKKLGL
ncbi:MULTISPECIES: L-seryl-tRNA(Sec) selenium transferase [unclassified Lentimicrobium]|uniref:L-seryl-tRNA(Sec) selenium transferase n=1 Tax=unclassified Lentimicrobium TaxID=2677434 RepID=UPI0015582127|nr:MULTISPECIES: L-seryl-tRNA(Sec) selenium transferase [unclassified Lentimicrobium]NPD46413.1 L-seryl-tRNA(Sec) selenium transferase [Lentimicrobium sp. S6]NPD83599.1 L-seryl-tRNA(Sec) selenium transferase [Lentimicrobium sp. L6]